jgi:hypothetical protein
VKPILFLDVDGPLNPYAAKPSRRPEGYETHRMRPSGFDQPWQKPLRVWLNPAHGSYLIALPYELMWATTWGAEANEWIAPHISLPELPAVDWPEVHAKRDDGTYFKTRAFPLADVLSVTTDTLLSDRHVDGLYLLLGYMTGQDVYTHELGIAADACAPALIAQYPWLADLQPGPGHSKAYLKVWLKRAEDEHGATLDVTPLADWVRRDPIEDAADMVGANKIWLPFTKD